jgi:hypothetical protein
MWGLEQALETWAVTAFLLASPAAVSEPKPARFLGDLWTLRPMVGAAFRPVVLKWFLEVSLVWTARSVAKSAQVVYLALVRLPQRRSCKVTAWSVARSALVV